MASQALEEFPQSLATQMETKIAMTDRKDAEGMAAELQRSEVQHAGVVVTVTPAYVF